MQKGSAALLLLIGVLVVIIGFFVLGQVKLPASELKSPVVNVSSESKDSVYKDQDLSFEFEYPKDFSVKEDSEEEFNKRGNGNYRKNFRGYVGYEPPQVLGAVAVLDKDDSFVSSPLSVWVFDNPEKVSKEQWFDDYWYYPFIWGVFDYTSKGHIVMDQEATISGQSAKYKIVSYQPGSPKFIYIAKGQKMYLFRIIGEAGDKLLSAFKFLN